MPDRCVNLILQQVVQHNLKEHIKGLKVKTAYFRRLLTNDFRNCFHSSVDIKKLRGEGMIPPIYT